MRTVEWAGTMVLGFILGAIVVMSVSVPESRVEHLEVEYCALALSTANSLTDSLAIAKSHEACEWWKSGPEMMEERK